MLLMKTGLVLLTTWAAGSLGLFSIGEAVNGLLLVGLMLLFVGFLKARDAARQRAADERRQDG